MLTGYKTVVFNIVMALVMIIKTIWPQSQIDVSVDDFNRFYDALTIVITTIWAVGNIILRAISKTKIFSKATIDECKDH